MFKNLAHSALIVCCLFSCQLYAQGQYVSPSGELLRDPTKPMAWRAPQNQTSAGPQEETFKLNYIVSSDGEKRAMINGKKVQVGDQLAGAKVLRIDANKVIIAYMGKHQELRLNNVKGIQRH